MIYLGGKITSGNLSGAEVALIGDTEIIGVNLSCARIDKGSHNLTLTGCNTHGLRTKTLPADWVKTDNLTVAIKTYFPLALEIRAIIKKSTGSYGLESWDFSLETLVNNTEMDEAQWRVKALEWKNKEPASEFENRAGKKNATDPAVALDLLVEWLVEEELMVQQENNFDGIAEMIRGHDLNAWRTGLEVVGAWE